MAEKSSENENKVCAMAGNEICKSGREEETSIMMDMSFTPNSFFSFLTMPIAIPYLFRFC